jgi:predicted AAA+ superfamily ATPase
MDKSNYKERIIDRKIQNGLKNFGAILIEGPKWCGKTWTMEYHSASVTKLTQRDARVLAEVDPRTALNGRTPHGIDEWQLVPEIWDEVRNSVDEHIERGQYLLTGSVSPQRGKTMHSGIGRISRMQMRTLSLYESGVSAGQISLKSLLNSEEIEPAKAEIGIYDIIFEACKGGWPINLSAEIENPLKLPYDYIDALSVPDDSGKALVRNIPQFNALIASLARNNASLIKSGGLHNEISKSTEDIAGNTLSAYLQHLRDWFILEEIPGWHPELRSKARLLSSPKRFLTDPSLAVAAMGASPEMLENNLSVFGGIFEGMCLRDLLIYADANDATLRHYRDDSNLEVDAIIELRNGDWGGFEIKLGGGETEKGVKSLLRLRDKIIKWGGREPRCLVVIVGVGITYRQKDGVYIVPISMLKD